MPNDAKLGLVVGVGLVITVAVLFFRKEPGVPAPPEPAAAVANQATTQAMPVLPVSRVRGSAE